MTDIEVWPYCPDCGIPLHFHVAGATVAQCVCCVQYFSIPADEVE